MTKRRKVLQRERQIARAIQETIHELDATREYRIVMFVDNDTALYDDETCVTFIHDNDSVYSELSCYDDAIKQALKFLF